MTHTLERKYNKTGIATAIVTAVGATVSGGAALAADKQLEEIIVTAQKRDTTLQETPLAITAITDAEIVQQRFQNFADYAGQIPGLAFSDRQPGAKSVIMRGCAAQGLAFSDSATTSVYLDEQPITYSGYNPDPRLIDVARIEALSGPQGSLFGDAAQCGTLRIITNKPDTEEFDGWIDLTGSSIADGGTGYDVSGMVNIPLQDNKVALRLVGFYADEAGWIDNILSPTPGQTSDNAAFVGDDVNESVWYGGRAALRINANDNWTVDLTGVYQYYELDGFGDVSRNEVLFADTSVFPTFDDREQARFQDDQWEDEWYQLAVTVEGQLEHGTFTFSANYFDRNSEYFADTTAYHQFLDGGYYSFAPLADPYSVSDPIGFAYDLRETKTWAVEARFATPTDGRWSAIVGAFYSRSEIEEIFYSSLQNLPGSIADNFANYAGYAAYNAVNKFGSGNTFFFNGTYDTEFDQYAIFGEVTVNLTENFSVSAGGRFYGLERDYTSANGRFAEDPSVLQCNAAPLARADFCFNAGFTGSVDEDGFVPKVTASYQFEDHLVYATYSEGFRRGGANSARPGSIFSTPRNDPNDDPLAGSLNQFDSDEVINYEFGAKTEWFDNSLRVNVAFYHMIWDDIQVQAEDPLPGEFAVGIVNFPEAEIDGVEAWVSWLPSDNLQVEATFGYNDGELSEDAVLFGGTAGEISVPEGTQLPIVPDWKSSVNVTYSFSEPMFGASPYFLLSYTYTGESVNSLAGVEILDSTVVTALGANADRGRAQDEWATVDLQFGLETESWALTFFVDNATDEEAELFFNNRWTQPRLSVNQPRTFGVNYRYYFN